MSKAVIGAKGCGNQSVKPDPNKPQVDCPCDDFLLCSTRLPYGYKAWSKNYAMTKSVIIYYGMEPALFMKYPYTGFYKRVRDMARQKQIKPLILHKLTDQRIKKRIERLVLKNGGDYTYSQKDMILRANLVDNGRILRSDGFGELEGEVYERLLPASGNSLDCEWNVDHIRTKAKGGCNRFCNAMVLSRHANKRKSDKGNGCICAEVKKTGAQGQEMFELDEDAKSPRHVLWQCYKLSNSGEKPVNKVPAFPPGMMKRYKSVKICDKDDPSKWSAEMQKKATDTLRAKISKISK